MRAIYNDQVSNIFIEGPVEAKPVEESLQEATGEKAAYHADLSTGYELEGGINDNKNSLPDPNERYD